MERSCWPAVLLQQAASVRVAAIQDWLDHHATSTLRSAICCLRASISDVDMVGALRCAMQSAAHGSPTIRAHHVQWIGAANSVLFLVVKCVLCFYV